MADREARVRLALQASAYMGGLNQVTQKTQAAFRSMARVGAKVGRGMFDGGKAAADSMLRTTKHVVGIAATLGGAFSLERALTESVQMQSRFRDIAFNVNKIAGSTTSWQEMQTMIEGAASRTSRRTGEMADAFQTVFAATGDAKFAAASLDAIGTAATASGESVSDLANAAQILQRKFGIGAKELPDALARMVEKTGVGGASLSEMGNRFAMMAGEASAAGIAGKEGVSQLLGMMKQWDSAAGEKLAPAMKNLLQMVKAGTTQMKAFRKATGIDADKLQGLDKFKAMLSGKGRAQAELMFTGDMRTVFGQLVQPFDDTVKKAKAAGKSQKEAEAMGVQAFEASLTKMGESAASYTKLQRAAAQRAKDDPMVHVREAQETLARAFADPDMIKAIGELSKDLPALAQGAAKFVRTFIEHPYLTGGKVVAGRLAVGAAAGGLKTGGSMLIQASVKGIGEKFAADAAGSAKWRAAGKMVGIAAAALIAFEVGKSFIEGQLNKDEKGNKELNAARAQVQALTQFGGTTEQKLAAAKKLQEAQDKVARTKTNLTTEVFGTAASWITGDKSLDPDARKSGNIAGASKDLKALLASMGGGAKTADRAADAQERLAKATDKAAANMAKLGAAPGGGHGLPPKPGNAPGYIPPPS